VGKYRLRRALLDDLVLHKDKSVNSDVEPPSSLSAPSHKEVARQIAISERTMEFVENSRSENTKRSYLSDWRHFEHWCQLQGVRPLPAIPETVADYLAHLAVDCKFRASTIKRKMSSISQAHKMKGYPASTSHEWVRTVWKGILRDPNTIVAQKGKSPALIEDIRMMVDVLVNIGGIKALRDRTLLLIGFAGALRRAELVALNVEDIEETREGLVATIRKSKTDQEGRGRKIAIPYGTRFETCPVRTYKQWLDESKITTGPVFRRMNVTHRLYPERLSDKGVARIVKYAAKLAGLDPNQYSGHSLRAGFATTAARAGASERSIMEQTGHKSLVVMRRYIRDGNLFRENAATYVGL